MRTFDDRGFALAALALTVFLGLAFGLHRSNSPLFDWIQAAKPRVIDAQPVVIVDVDEKALEKYGQWPWPRTLLAQLVTQVKQGAPVAIGLDIIMPEADRHSPHLTLEHHPHATEDLRRALSGLPTNDLLLANALREGEVPVIVGNAGVFDTEDSPSPPPVLVNYGVEDPSLLEAVPHYQRILRNVDELESAAPGHGMLNAAVDDDGIVRRIPLIGRSGDKLYPAISLEFLRLAQRAPLFRVSGKAGEVHGVTVGELYIPTTAAGETIVRFSESSSARYVSAADVLDGTLSPDRLEAKLVLIGVTALGLSDAPPTPVSPRMNGVEIQAQLLENLLYGTHLTRPQLATWIEVGAGVLLGIALIALLPLVSPLIGLGAFVAAVVGLLAASSYALVAHGMLFDGLAPAVHLIVTFLVLNALLLVESKRSQRELAQALHEERVMRARVEGELGAARDIQQGILPDAAQFALPPGCSLHATLESAAEVGGDLYDIAWLDEERLFLVLGDVSGKGVPASLFMAVSKTLCKSNALRSDPSASAILTRANREIARENPELLFVTAIAVIVNVNTGELDLAAAGHEAPFVISGNTPPRRLVDTGGPPLCAVDDYEYPPYKAQLQPGETLVLATDGISEAMNMAGEFYGSARMADALSKVTDLDDAAAICARLTGDVEAFVGEAKRSDDIALLAFRFAPDALPGA